jgi:hypothetical protein
MIEITKAEYVSAYKIHFVFSDGQQRLADFYPFLSTSTHRLINKFLDLNLFKQFYFENWAVRWGDNECDLNPMEIYYGEFEAADSPYKEDIKAVVKARKLKEIDDRMKRRIDRAKKDAQREKKMVMAE